MTKLWMSSLALCTLLACASSPPPAPIEPVPADPAGATPAGYPSEGPTAPPPLVAEPAMATTPTAADPTPGPSGSAGPSHTDRHPAVDPARPSAGAAPASARSTTTSARGSTRSTATPTAASTSAPAYTGPDPCKLAVDGDSPVDKACREGGLKAAKLTMKAMLKDARAAGARFDCDDCHINEEDYAQLSQGTDEKFAKLLAASRK